MSEEAPPLTRPPNGAGAARQTSTGVWLAAVPNDTTGRKCCKTLSQVLKWYAENGDRIREDEARLIDQWGGW